MLEERPCTNLMMIIGGKECFETNYSDVLKVGRTDKTKKHKETNIEGQ